MAAEGFTEKEKGDIASRAAEYFQKVQNETIGPLMEKVVSEGLAVALGDASKLTVTLNQLLTRLQQIEGRVVAIETALTATATAGGAGAAPAVNPATRAAPAPAAAPADGAKAPDAPPANPHLASSHSTYNSFWKYLLATQVLGPNADSKNEAGYLCVEVAAVSLNDLIRASAPEHATLTAAEIQGFWANVNKRSQRKGAPDDEKKEAAATAILRGLKKEQRDALSLQWKNRKQAEEETSKQLSA